MTDARRDAWRTYALEVMRSGSSPEYAATAADKALAAEDARFGGGDAKEDSDAGGSMTEIMRLRGERDQLRAERNEQWDKRKAAEALVTERTVQWKGWMQRHAEAEARAKGLEEVLEGTRGDRERLRAERHADRARIAELEAQLAAKTQPVDSAAEPESGDVLAKRTYGQGEHGLPKLIESSAAHDPLDVVWSRGTMHAVATHLQEALAEVARLRAAKPAEEPRWPAVGERTTGEVAWDHCMACPEVRYGASEIKPRRGMQLHLRGVKGEGLGLVNGHVWCDSRESAAENADEWEWVRLPDAAANATPPEAADTRSPGERKPYAVGDRVRFTEGGKEREGHVMAFCARGAVRIDTVDTMYFVNRENVTCVLPPEAP